MKKLKVTILFDVEEDADKEENADSVNQQVKEVLVSKDHDVKLLPVEADVRKLVGQLEKDQSDLIFNLCESFGGVSQHEQHVAALLEIMGRRFTGAASIGLALAQDKGLSKKIFQFHGLPYPKFSTMDAGQVEWADDLDFPLFVKPLNEDASIGIDSNAVVQNVKDLMERISYIHTELKGPALIEEYIEGREIYVGVLGNESPEALPIIEWDFSKVPKGAPKIASSEAKWDEDSVYKDAPQVFPTDIPEPVVQRIQGTAISAFRALKLRDYGRVDMRLCRSQESSKKRKSEFEGWEFYIIEANPNPYLDRKAELAMAARKHGLEYPELVERIMELAMTR
jgi:D-alanine-D-alanine ligase